MSDAQYDDQHIDATTGEVTQGGLKLLAVTAEMSVVSSEINQQIATARRFPRRKDKTIAQEIVERATLSEEIASECFYRLERQSGGDKKAIIGPSIRLAEIVMASYGNIRVAARYVRIDNQDPARVAVVVEAVAMDMQTNHAVLKQVRRSIMTSLKGGAPRMFTADMVNVTIMAAQSIAQRDAALQLVPKALWIDGYHAAMSVVKGDEKTLGARRAAVLNAFGKAGIKPAQLFTAMGIDSEQEITLDHMVVLAGMWTALKEGEAVDSVLGRVVEGRGGEPARNPLQDPPAQGKQETKPAPEAAKVASNTSAPTGVKQEQSPEPAQEAGKQTAQASEPKAAVEQRPAAETAQAAGEPQASADLNASDLVPNAEYMAFALNFIDTQPVADKLKKWWKAERNNPDRKALSEEQTDRLEASYYARLELLEGVGNGK